MSQPLPVDPTPLPADDLPDPKAKGWFAAVLPVVLIAIFGELGMSVLANSALPVYVSKGLGVGTGVYGWLLAAFYASEALTKAPLGALSDRFGRKPLILLGSLVTVFTPIFLISIHYDPASATAIAALLAVGFLRALDGMGQAAMWPALYAYVGDTVAEARRATAMGALNVAYMLGLAFAFLAGGFVDDTFGPLLTHDAGVTLGGQISQVTHRVRHNLAQTGHHLAHLGRHAHAGGADAVAPIVVNPVYQPGHYIPSFYLASFLFALAAITAMLGLRNRKHTTMVQTAAAAQEASLSWAQFLSALKCVPQFLWIALVMFLGIGCIIPLVKLFALDEFKITETQFGILTLGPSLVIAAIAVPAGRLADAWGKTQSVRLGFVLATLGLWGIPLIHHLHGGQEAFVATASLLGIGFVLAFPAWMALLSSLGGDHQRGTIFASVSTAQGVGAGLGVLIGTRLYQHAGHIAPFVVSASLATAGSLLALIFIRDAALRRSKVVGDC